VFESYVTYFDVLSEKGRKGDKDMKDIKQMKKLREFSYELTVSSLYRM
jgi:hypothetical protein